MAVAGTAVLVAVGPATAGASSAGAGAVAGARTGAADRWVDGSGRWSPSSTWTDPIRKRSDVQPFSDISRESTAGSSGRIVIGRPPRASPSPPGARAEHVPRPRDGLLSPGRPGGPRVTPAICLEPP